ncbi:MAG: Asp23/Gls24 family envelope stress response protein [Clostridiaceae bacterium]|nr:Asp23/Gls24 family envelope stress response protein [Clostridiaceae bacterium]MDD6275121.1 Asp23/Gls24 family envelope stress response protein [Clostridiaceae bacterium]
MKEEEKTLGTGNVKISEDVVASIVTIAANEVEGVAVTPASALDFAERWGKKGMGRGVRVTLEEKTVAIELCVQMTYGIKIPQTALKVQQKVKMAVESMTGLTVRNINVTVSGVSFDKEKKGE